MSDRLSKRKVTIIGGIMKDQLLSNHSGLSCYVCFRPLTAVPPKAVTLTKYELKVTLLVIYVHSTAPIS